jgi:uncharacterized membrane protein
MLRSAAVSVAEDALKNFSNGSSQSKPSRFSGAKAGAKGLAAGAGLVALAPLAKKGFDAVSGPGGPAKAVGDKVGDKLKESVSEKVDDAGGVGGIAKDAAGGLFGGGIGGGDDDGGGDGMQGVGKGRRMPVQQSVDVAVPRETAYNQFCQFEDWPEFMHRVTRVTQDDDCTVSFATKIWGKTKEFTANIDTQRPDQRIKWKVSQGITHTGVVTFHELAPELTRVEVSLDVDPGSLIEKAARGMRHVKRAVRGDLHRFKAFIEMMEQETGAWRGVIEDGEVVEEHDPSYDEEREYGDIEDLQADESEDEDEDEGDEESEDEEAEEPEAEADDEEEAEEEEEEEEEEERQPARAQRSRSRSSSSRRGSSKNGGSPSRSTRSRARSSRS